MKLLLDMCVTPSLVEVANSFGHQAVHAKDIGLHEMPDESVIRYARHHSCVIVTMDLDFPRILALDHAAGPGTIVFRGNDYNDRQMMELLARVLTEVPADALEHSITVVEPTRLRISHLPIERNDD